MIPSNFIRKCKECSGHINQPTLRTSNLIGAVQWTDGKTDAPMRPIYPELVECPHCHSVLWIEDQEIIGRRYEYFMPLSLCLSPKKRFREEMRRKNQKRPIDLSADDYYRYLDTVLLEPDREVYVRKYLWRLENDRRRYDRCKKYRHYSKREKRNMLVLERILDDSEDINRLIKAEIHRELGDFDQTLVHLRKPFKEKFNIAAERIRALAKAGERCVRTLVDL